MLLLFCYSAFPILFHIELKGRLWASDRNSPTVVVVAHYDSHSAVPSLSQGADSNGSGVAALLELLAILSQFYASVSSSIYCYIHSESLLKGCFFWNLKI